MFDDYDASQILDVSSTTLDEWLSLVLDPPEGKLFVRNMFPSDRHREEFLAGLRDRSEAQVKMVLRHFLVSHGSNLKDRFDAEYLVATLRDRKGLTEHEMRLLKHHISKWEYPVWEGIGWILDLLPKHPKKALNVMDGFFHAHWEDLTDNYLEGWYDARAVIRQRYIVDPADGPKADTTLEGLKWRELEYLCGTLFRAMGYAVKVTPPRGDKGVDVIASRETSGARERVVIQCKKYGQKHAIERDDVVHLIGAMDRHRATRGILITTGPVRRGARALQRVDPRVEVIDRKALLMLLAEYEGTDWHTRVDRLMYIPRSTETEDDDEYEGDDDCE